MSPRDEFNDTLIIGMAPRAINVTLAPVKSIRFNASVAIRRCGPGSTEPTDCHGGSNVSRIDERNGCFGETEMSTISNVASLPFPLPGVPIHPIFYDRASLRFRKFTLIFILPETRNILTMEACRHQEKLGEK